MSDLQRGIVKLLEDLDRRARPGRPSRYRAIQKYVSITDTFRAPTDSQTLTVLDKPMQWQTASASSFALTWGLGEWQ